MDDRLIPCGVSIFAAFLLGRFVMDRVRWWKPNNKLAIAIGAIVGAFSGFVITWVLYILWLVAQGY